MPERVPRRMVLGGIGAMVAAPALAEAPRTSLRPPQNPRRAGTAVATTAPPAVAAPEAESLIRAADLGGKVAFAVADARTGLVLEAREGGTPMPPASTLKTITSLYALETLGADHRFVTRILAAGPVTGGRADGDLVLEGGGDPTLSTDHLGDMAARLRARLPGGAAGGFAVWGDALPYLRAIDETQPDWLGYNPAVAGLNLNFNRVHFEWRRKGADYQVSMDARGERFLPAVSCARVTLSARERPVYAYSDRGRIEEWSVARAALGKAGSRWLPVRRPDAYAAEVLQVLARAQGVRLDTARRLDARPKGEVLVENRSDPLPAVLRDMMKYSTNMTAEAVGMAASVRRGADSHVASARAMTDWLAARTGIAGMRFADHSGLAGASRVTAIGMAQALGRLGPAAGLRGLMKPVEFRDAGGRKLKTQPFAVQAKTGTLNFVSSLVGYMTTPGGTDLVFAILTADVARRDAIPDAQKEDPPGAGAWVKRSKRLQQQLLERWAAVYG